MFILPVSLEGLTKLALGESRRHSIFKHLLWTAWPGQRSPCPSVQQPLSGPAGPQHGSQQGFCTDLWT